MYAQKTRRQANEIQKKPDAQYMKGSGFCLLSVKVINVCNKICSDISICRDDHKFICILYKIDIVPVFFLNLMECIGVVNHIVGALQIGFLRIVGKLVTVLLEMLGKITVFPKFVCAF